MSCAATCAIRLTLERVCWASTKVDTVLHLAAQTIVGIANRNPISTFETNIAGDLGIAGSRAPRSPKVQAGGRRVVRQSLWFCAHAALCRDDARWMGEHPYDVSEVLCRPDRAKLREGHGMFRSRSRDAATSSGAAISIGIVSYYGHHPLDNPRASTRSCGRMGNSSAITSTPRTRSIPTSHLAEALRRRSGEFGERSSELFDRQAAGAFSKSWDANRARG